MAQKQQQKFAVVKDRVEYYKDFTLNLLHYIYQYYLDKQTLAEDADIRNHFMFCYNKVCNEFLEEGVDFKSNDELIDYFYTYYYNHFYTIEKDVAESHFLKFWKGVFDIDKQRNKSILKMMGELYATFNQSVDVEKNILELI